MPEQIQDEIVAFENYKEYDISYPVIITRWEIKQVRGFNKQYLQVYFQKISDNVRAFHFNVKCYSVLGEVVDEITELSIDKVDKKNFQFSEIVPLKVEARRIEIALKQCCMLDNSVIEPKGKQIAISNFKPFNNEDLEAAKRLLLNAKGLPVDNVSHWYCACGVLHSSDTQSCLNCNKSKKEIFSLFTSDRIEEVKKEKEYNAQKQKIKRIIMGTFVFIIGLITLVALFFPILKVSEENIVVNGFNIGKLSTGWGEILYYSIFQLVVSICTMVVSILTIFFFSDKKATKILIIFAIICGLLMLIYLIVGGLIFNTNMYLEVRRYSSGEVEYEFEERLCSSSADWIKHYNVKSLYWLGFVLFSIITGGFIIFNIFFNRIYNKINKDKK